MESGGKSGSEEEDEAEKQEKNGGKLERGFVVGKRGGPGCCCCCCTTPVPTWKLSFDEEEEEGEGLNKGFNNYTSKAPPTIVSARKLGASLWEEVHYLHIAKMRKGAGVKQPRQYREKGLELPTHFAEPSHRSPEQPGSASSLRKHVAASLRKHHHTIESSAHALRPVSPASYSSSMEVMAYNPPLTPTSSLDVNERRGESSYNLKTSTELLKVLNRIWSLEEQHTSNISLMKTLKNELNHARSRIKELLQEQQADRQEMDYLIKQVEEDNLVRKSKEQERIKSAVQTVRNELEDERSLRKRSECLHRRLARELSELKFSFANTLKELERERKARILLEDLCDEFAKGIGEYEHEVRAMNHKSEKNLSGKDDYDRLVLHISEAWLDERMQMKLAGAPCNLSENNTVVDKLSSEIETFLQAKRSGSSNTNDTSKDNLQRLSLESVNLNEGVSVPNGNDDVENYANSDPHCNDLTKNVDDKEKDWDAKKRDENPKLNGEESIEAHHGEPRKSYATKKKLGSRERIKGHTPSNLELQFAERMARDVSYNGSKLDKGQGKSRHEEEAIPHDTDSVQNAEDTETIQAEIHKRKVERDEIHGSNSNFVTDTLIRSQSLLSGREKFFPEKDDREGSCSHFAWRGHASPVRPWMPKLTAPDIEISDSSSKWPRGMKETTLKAKLLEARLEGQHSRYKASKGT